MLLLAVFTSRYNLICEATKIIPLSLPHEHKLCSSLNEFKLLFKNLRDPLVKHFYCNQCLGYIKNTSVQKCPFEILWFNIQFQKCPIYHRNAIRKSNQIRNLFAQKGFYDRLSRRFDGAPVFKSSKTSIWPIYLIVTELPYKQRNKENMILASLWYGNKNHQWEHTWSHFQILWRNSILGYSVNHPTKRGFMQCSVIMWTCRSGRKLTKKQYTRGSRTLILT